MDSSALDRPVNPKWTARDIVARSWQVLRQEGVVSLWFKMLGELFYRRLVVIEQPLPPSGRGIRLSEDVQTGSLTPDDLDEYIAARPLADRETVRQRLQQGEACLLTRKANQIVAVCWAATGQGYIEYLYCRIQLAPDRVYLYEALAIRQFHGTKTGHQLNAYVAEHFHKAGYAGLVGAVLPENERALRMFRKMGFRPVGWISCYRLGPWRHYSLQFAPGIEPFSMSREPAKPAPIGATDTATTQARAAKRL